mmetsp:Transcript_5460/g.10829  ORF Transcript_5460/g.10829 Transcript_5460/m.10829 type:complete len:129 (+) Transcript_5460:79-465(+)
MAAASQCRAALVSLFLVIATAVTADAGGVHGESFLAVARVHEHRASTSLGPLFSAESCTEMFTTMKKLGSPVPPSEFVTGCTEVCAKVKELKEYWATGAMADYACSQGATYGCVWVGTPPTTLKDIGC